MKHFRLNLLLRLTATVAATAAATVMFMHGMWAPACLAAIVAVVAAMMLMALVGRLSRTLSLFATSLEMNDVTVKFDFGKDDRTLRQMAETMNRIVHLYRDNTRQYETGKLYYDRILRIMTHEMRNSITPIAAIAADMEKHPAKYPGDNLSEAIAVIKGQSEGIKHFLDAYYSMTHIPSPEKKTVDAIDFFGTVMTKAKLEATNRGLSADVCTFTVARGLILDIDTALMDQALANLIRNALDAVADVADPAVKVTVTSSDGQPYISVEDNGHGIAPSIAENLFQPFHTTKPGGSGVGLYLSRQIVRQHGGDLSLSQLPSGGAAARIHLPAPAKV